MTEGTAALPTPAEQALRQALADLMREYRAYRVMLCGRPTSPAIVAAEAALEKQG